MFVRESWYVAALADEIGHEPLARTILGDGIVLFRAEDGSPFALEGRCCHRHLPLSLGKVVGDQLQASFR